MELKFIKTTDYATSILLQKLGCVKVSESSGVYIFLNSDKVRFSTDIDKSKIQYSNILTF
jgi:hypothetical protein